MLFTSRKNPSKSWANLNLQKFLVFYSKFLFFYCFILSSVFNRESHLHRIQVKHQVVFEVLVMLSVTRKINLLN